MKSTHSIEARIRVIVAEVMLVPTSALTLDDDLQLTLGMDSLSLLRIVADVEQEFAVAIPDEDFNTIRTLRSLIAYAVGAPAHTG